MNERKLHPGEVADASAALGAVNPQLSAAEKPGTRLPGALIIGGAHGSLAIARSLGERGIPVWVATGGHPVVRFSRFRAKTVAWSSDEPDAVAKLIAIARTNKLENWVLFAGGDAEVKLVAEHHDELAAVFRLTTPPWETTRWAHDKRLTYERAATVGVDAPRSFYPKDRDDVAAQDFAYPVILKPTSRDTTNAFTLAKVWRAGDRAALLALYDRAVAMVGAPAVVLQELIPGDGMHQFSYAALWDRGAPVASLVARRTRQYPVDFGYTSTCVETVDRPEVEAAAVKFLKSLDYSGLVEVEFKYDDRDRRYKILDVNPRAWSWTALGAAAGVDFPYLAWRLAVGEPLLPLVRARPGVVWMHLSRDIVAAAQEWARGNLSIRDYLSVFRKPIVFAAFSGNDPLPAIADLPLVLWRYLSRRLPARLRSLKH
ncbi:MAG: ATP-grasp domain-containing protein [Bauldia sp.]